MMSYLAWPISSLECHWDVLVVFGGPITVQDKIKAILLCGSFRRSSVLRYTRIVSVDVLLICTIAV